VRRSGRSRNELGFAGIGTALVGHALERAVLGARLTGGRALLARAIDEEAIDSGGAAAFFPLPPIPTCCFDPFPISRPR
jgi:hypothetical protein